MKKNLVNIDWNSIDNYSDMEISYFLFLENKSIDTISRIRNLDKSTVQNHIISGKIKYRFLANSKSIDELFMTIVKAGKEDRLLFIKSMDENNKAELVKYIRKNYADMPIKNKERAVWIIGELNNAEGIDILMKASVNKAVNVRRMAVSAMGKLKAQKCETALLRALDDENAQVVLYAVKALKNIKSTKAVSKIQNIKNTAQKKYLIKAADDYIEKEN